MKDSVSSHRIQRILTLQLKISGFYRYFAASNLMTGDIGIVTVQRIKEPEKVRQPGHFEPFPKNDSYRSIARTFLEEFNNSSFYNNRKDT
jgi:hypothetical protein